jgi:hypothetical protein
MELHHRQYRKKWLLVAYQRYNVYIVLAQAQFVGYLNGHPFGTTNVIQGFD